MKRIGGLFDRIASPEVLGAALWRAGRGKAARAAVRCFRAAAPRELDRIREELRFGRYRFGPYTSFEVRDPKSRTIHAPPFRDRVVHHAMIAVCGPVFERGATAHSYACRAGLGPRRALLQAARWARTSPAFLKIDVHRYYDSISHPLLLAALARRFRERRLLALFEHLLASYEAVPEEGLRRSSATEGAERAHRGLPIGALTGQYLGNFFLDPIDHWTLERAGCRRSLRYMDDLLFFGDLSTLRRLRPRVLDQLARLGLTPSRAPILNTCGQGLPWLGFTVYPNRIRSSARGRKRLRRRLGELERRCRRGAIDETTLQARATSLFTHARQAHDLAWRRTLLAAHSYGEAPELREARHAGRLLEQPRQEVPFRHPQQEASWQPQQEPGLPPLPAPRHGGAAPRGPLESPSPGPPDDAPSRAPRREHPLPAAGDESPGRASAGIDIPGSGRPAEKTPTEAPPTPGGGSE